MSLELLQQTGYPVESLEALGMDGDVEGSYLVGAPGVLPAPVIATVSDEHHAIRITGAMIAVPVNLRRNVQLLRASNDLPLVKFSQAGGIYLAIADCPVSAPAVYLTALIPCVSWLSVSTTRLWNSRGWGARRARQRIAAALRTGLRVTAALEGARAALEDACDIAGWSVERRGPGRDAGLLVQTGGVPVVLTQADGIVTASVEHAPRCGSAVGTELMLAANDMPMIRCQTGRHRSVLQAQMPAASTFPTDIIDLVERLLRAHEQIVPVLEALRDLPRGLAL